MMKSLSKICSVIIVSSILLVACSKGGGEHIHLVESDYSEVYDGEVAEQWMQLELRLFRQTSPSLGITPPIASRALGYTALALYETVAAGSQEYKSLASQLQISLPLPKPNSNYRNNWALAANASMSRMIKNLFPNLTAQNIASIDSLQQALQKRYTELGDTTITRRYSEAFGYAMADTLFSWSKSDGGHNAYLTPTLPSYIPPVGPSFWVPTLPALAAPLHPTWGNNRPFLREDTTGACIAPAPIVFSTVVGSPFYNEAMEVYTTSQNITATQTLIARYWADGGGTITPPGHSMAIAVQTAKEKKLNLADAAAIYAKVGIAVSDAFIACWRNKYKYNLQRPITYIRNNISATWLPLITTPPFPEYVSGHSTQSSATAEILTAQFGSSYTFSDSSKIADGNFLPRTFANFTDMASEAAISRLYGGIHFRNGNEKGLACGKAIGGNVNRIRFK
jgi:membrane-associated phospholipid phosphatase